MSIDCFSGEENWRNLLVLCNHSQDWDPSIVAIFSWFHPNKRKILLVQQLQ